MKKFILAVTILLASTICFAEPINLPDVISKLPEVHQSYVLILDDDLDQAFLTSFTAASWKTINLEVGFLSEDGIAVALSTDLIETPQIKFPILKYLQIKPVVGYSISRLFSGEQEEGNKWGIADNESWFIGAQLIKLQF